MKIGILTQALHGNYGGILQNFALQQVLIGLGHSPVTIDRHILRSESLIKQIAKKVYQNLRQTYDTSLLTRQQRIFLCRNQLAFINKYIESTGPVFSQAEFDIIVKDKSFDGFIVGSDQCWRPCYSANILNYFLDFTSDREMKRIAYAASFGVDQWEFTREQSEIVKQFARLFDAISVREYSGLDLCKNHLEIDATWVLDPTMLLGPEGFNHFISKKNDSAPFISDYLLEYNPIAEEIIEKIKKTSGIKESKQCNPSPVFSRKESWKNHMGVPVEKWITNIATSSFVITDSFHGVAFSIMYNVPFIVILNNTRGNARIESILKDFELENCLCVHLENVNWPEINWTKVNSRLEERRIQSMAFLTEALK